MKTLFLHGWNSVPGVKPSYLKDHEVINPKLPDDDFDEAVRIAPSEFDQHHPQIVVGSSRGGAVAMNNGDVRRNGSVIGQASGVTKEQAAAIFFFGFFD